MRQILNSLQQKGMVNMIFDKPTRFVGIDYAKTPDHVIKHRLTH